MDLPDTHFPRHRLGALVPRAADLLRSTAAVHGEGEDPGDIEVELTAHRVVAKGISLPVAIVFAVEHGLPSFVQDRVVFYCGLNEDGEPALTGFGVLDS